VCVVKRDSGQPVAVYPWHCLVPFLAASSKPAAIHDQQQQQPVSSRPTDKSPASASITVTGMSSVSSVHSLNSTVVTIIISKSKSQIFNKIMGDQNCDIFPVGDDLFL